MENQQESLDISVLVHDESNFWIAPQFVDGLNQGFLNGDRQERDAQATVVIDEKECSKTPGCNDDSNC